MKLALRALAISLLSLCFTFVVPASGYAAWDPFGGTTCSGDASTSAVCTDKAQTGNPLTGTDGLIMKVVNIIALVGGMVAVVIIILAGLRMVTSGGSAEDVAGARRSLIYATVGLLIIALSRTLVAFILGKI